jgi:hypothetical protein
MQLLDDNLWMHFQAGKISAEEAIDKSKNPGFMVDRMQRAGILVNKQDDALIAEAEDAAGSSGAAAPAAAGGAAAKPGSSEAEKQAAIVANRARMQAMMGKKS